MTTDDTTPRSSPGLTFTLILVCAVSLSLAFMSWINSSSSPVQDPTGGLAAGQPAPELAADVWVQGKAPDPSELEGEVYVVVAWATWCYPCYREAPHLVEVHNQFKAEGVRFFGLTREPPEVRQQIMEWLDDRDVTWPIGIAADSTLEQYRADYIPGIWVIGRDGKVWWNRGMSRNESLEEALRRTLDNS